MGKSYRAWQPHQSYLLPPSPDEWLKEDHLVYFLLDLIDELDVSAIEEKYQRRDWRGTRPYDPRMMVMLLVYGYSVGIPSSRKLEKATHENVALRVLTGGQQPDHTRISEFRRVHLEELGDLFLQVLRLCQEAGLVKLGHVSLDGTKMKANASKHKAMSHDRMKKAEEALHAEIAELMKRAEAADTEEDEKYGRDKTGEELPEELKRREQRLVRIREARKKLEAEAAAAKARERRKETEEAKKQAAEAGSRDQQSAQNKVERSQSKASRADGKAREKAEIAGESEPNLEPRRDDEFPLHQIQADKDGEAEPKAQRNFTDPESCIMKTGSGFVQAYNAQAIVDEHAQIIVAEHVSNQPPDAEYFIPMFDELERNCGRRPAIASADAGYWSETNAAECEKRGIDAFIATGRLRRGEKAPPEQGPMPADLDAKGKMRFKLRTENGRKVYARRKAIVEPVFGQIKEAQKLRGFLLRGMKKAQGEFTLICTTHNLLKLYRAGLQPG